MTCRGGVGTEILCHRTGFQQNGQTNGLEVEGFLFWDGEWERWAASLPARPPRFSKGQANFPASVKGKGGHGQNDERVAEPPTGP